MPRHKFTPMKTQTIDDIKIQLELFRNNLVEEFEDPNKQVQLKINGHFKVLYLKVPHNPPREEIVKLVPELFTKAIETIGNRIRLKLEQIQTVPQ